MDDSLFAEIEIEQTQNRSPEGESALRFFSSITPAASEPIKPRIIDPIREKFYEMRKLASARPFARSDSELFYRQARFMEDFTDDYDGNAKFNMYYPYYQNMGYEYLRTYFTWRTNVRNGDIKQTSLSYIFLYIYEILSGIGTKNPEDGLNKLILIWNAFSKEYTPIEKYLSKWFKDYFVFYELQQTFIDFINEHQMQKYYSLTLLFDENAENKLELWNSLSGYNIKLSKFYKEDNQQLLADCFNVVLKEVQKFCSARNTRFEDLLVYSVSRRSPWQPFKQALFQSRARQTDREIKLSEFERYYCKHGEWTANLPIYYSSQKDFIGYIIKKTEACLRNELKYKYKLVADIKAGSKPFRELQRPAAKRAELDKTIEKAVADFYREINLIAVKVDHTNLARIREEAKETQDQLIVPESDMGTVLPAPCQGDGSPGTLDISDQYSEQPVTLSFADGWKALKTALTDTERKALTLALQENSDIKAFADENNIMLEVLADSINEKAADYIGDNLLELEDDLYIYPEYHKNITEICM